MKHTIQKASIDWNRKGWIQDEEFSGFSTRPSVRCCVCRCSLSVSRVSADDVVAPFAVICLSWRRRCCAVVLRRRRCAVVVVPLSLLPSIGCRLLHVCALCCSLYVLLQHHYGHQQQIQLRSNRRTDPTERPLFRSNQSIKRCEPWMLYSPMF